MAEEKVTITVEIEGKVARVFMNEKLMGILSTFELSYNEKGIDFKGVYMDFVKKDTFEGARKLLSAEQMKEGLRAYKDKEREDE